MFKNLNITISLIGDSLCIFLKTVIFKQHELEVYRDSKHFL